MIVLIIAISCVLVLYCMVHVCLVYTGTNASSALYCEALQSTLQDRSILQPIAMMLGNLLVVTPLAHAGHFERAGYFGAVYGLVLYGTWQLMLLQVDRSRPVQKAIRIIVGGVILNLITALIFNAVLA